MSLQLCDATKTHDWFQAVALSLAEEIFFNSVSSSKQCSVPLLLEAFLVKPPLNRSKLLLIGIICIIQKSASFVEKSLWMLLGKKKKGGFLYCIELLAPNCFQKGMVFLCSLW